jgi:nucleoside-triphosphatase THEP1
MELFSPSFRQAVLAALKSGQKVLGTIMASHHPFADSIKQRPEVELLKLNRNLGEEIKIKVLSFVHDI